MKNNILKLICAFLIVGLLFSGCIRNDKKVVEIKTAPIETNIEDSIEQIQEEISNEQENIVIVEKEAEESLVQTEPPKENETKEDTTEFVCSLIVRCDDVLKNIDKLKEEKRSIVPENGIIYENANISFSEGESAFDVLNRELIKNRIHFEFVNTPMYNSAYIEGIGNLYEFDCGSLSGWQYRVNEIKPNFGCSSYTLRTGDKIEFYYSCNFLDDNAKNS